MRRHYLFNFQIYIIALKWFNLINCIKFEETRSGNIKKRKIEKNYLILERILE
jgi:hypothetical protein